MQTKFPCHDLDDFSGIMYWHDFRSTMGDRYDVDDSLIYTHAIYVLLYILIINPIIILHMWCLYFFYIVLLDLSTDPYNEHYMLFKTIPSAYAMSGLHVIQQYEIETNGYWP